MSDDTWPEGEPSFDAEGGDDGTAWLDGGDDTAYSSESSDIDTVDLQIGDDDDEPGAAADPDEDATPDHDDDLGLHDGLASDDGDLDPGDHQDGLDDDGEPDVDEPTTDDSQSEETTWFASDLTDEPELGADPDHDDLVDSDGWSSDAFPPELDFADPPEPVDGLPWSDPAMLGDINDGLIDTDQTEYVTPDVSDLLDYSGTDSPASGGDVWAELLGSNDPATSGLARWWAPG